jgi:hypothetical protein
VGDLSGFPSKRVLSEYECRGGSLGATGAIGPANHARHLAIV